MDRVHKFCKKSPNCLPKWLLHVASPPIFILKNEWEFLLLHMLARIWYCQFSGFGHSNRCLVIYISILICISLMMYDMVGLFSYSFVIFTFSLVRCMLGSLIHFKSGVLFPYSWVLRVLCIFWITIFVKCVFYKYFLSVCGLFSHYLDIIFHRAKGFVCFVFCIKFNLSIISFIDFCVWYVLFKKSLLHSRLSRFLSIIFQEFYGFVFFI